MTTPEGALARALQSHADALTPGLRKRMMSAAIGMDGVIALGRGDPDFDTPAHIIDAATTAMRTGLTHYTQWTGLPELRHAIARKLLKRNGITADPNTEIIVTGGAQVGAFIAMQVLVADGDEVLVDDPHYSAYDVGVALAGGVVVPVPTSREQGFAAPAEAVERLMTPRTKVLLLVDPGNPSGAVHTRQQLIELAEVAVRHNLVVVSDEVYEDFTYGEPRHESFASLPGMRDRTVSLFSLSKTYAMTGWRIGYIAAPSQFVERAAELHYAISICAPSIAQVAGIAALDGPHDHLDHMRLVLRERRDLLTAGLAEMGLPCWPPAGGFTVLADIRPTGLDSVEFCLRVLHEAHVQVFPGVMYGPAGEGYARISFLADREGLREALDRMRAVVGPWIAAHAAGDSSG